MKFGNLTYLFLLWLIPCLVFFYIYTFLKRAKSIKIFCGEKLFPKLVPSIQKGRQKLKAFLLIAGIFFLLIALVRPKWGFHWEDIKRLGVDIIVAVDVSKSMLAQDVEPNRLERAKREVYDLCGMLDGDRIGLIAFAGTSFVQCPLTLDYGAFRMFLDYLDPDLIPTPGTEIGGVIQRAMESFSRRERESKALIIITDGEDHGKDLIDIAKKAKKEGIKIFTIGIGSLDGTPIPLNDGSGGFLKDRKGNLVLSRLDEKTLQKIALETGGIYVRSVTGDMDLEKIYRSQIKGTIEQKELRSTRKKRWEERFQWFVLIGLILVVTEYFIRER
jgi:Ca-activated chloride channel family protein